MYKKGTILVRVRVVDWSSIGIGSIVRLEATAHSRNANYLVTRLKTVELPGHQAPIPQWNITSRRQLRNN